MNNLTLYLVAVLIWGSTWLVITFQLGRVPPEMSVVYRFALAGVMLLLWSLARKLRLRFSLREHGWMALQGALLFGLNYVCVYLAESRISSGLVAVIFSLIVFLNIVGARLFFQTPIRPATVLAALLGVGGVALIFLPEFRQPARGAEAVAGVIYSLVGTVSACAGNLLSARNQRHGLPVVQLNTFGMLYGAAFVGLYAVARGQRFIFDASPSYVLALGYLALFGSVLAFGAYLTLVGRIGADRAGYTAAAIPIVALLFSAGFEGLRLGPTEVLGIALCVAGNILVLRKRPASTPPKAEASAVARETAR
jgi:drug/metabolite transporter (DMT)-like permease